MLARNLIKPPYYKILSLHFVCLLLLFFFQKEKDLDKMTLTLLMMGIFIVSSINFSTSNILQNPSFETDHHWILNFRQSMWMIRPADEMTLRYSADQVHDGNRSLLFPSRSKEQAVFASQYVDVSDLDLESSKRSWPVEASFWYSGQDCGSFKLSLDIAYADGRYLHVEISPEKPSSPGGFVKHCITVPGYGQISALMAHLLVDDKHAEDIYIDDANIDFVNVTSLSAICPIYLKSFPPSRNVINNYFKPTGTFHSSSVTLATQLTFDRLDNLEEIASVWRGPISAVLFFTRVGDLNEPLSRFIHLYFKSNPLRQYVTFHMVFGDQLNNLDGSFYPANTLRNIALENSNTDYVFYVDADIIPTFNASIAESRVIQTDMTSECLDKTCAFIIPLFHAKTLNVKIPKNKTSLLNVLKEDAPSIEAFSTVSHSVVRYRDWYTADRAYEVKYKHNMEPYFIAESTAPLMNELFVGYGRDKCAYSKELHWAGKFRDIEVNKHKCAYVQTLIYSIIDEYRPIHGENYCFRQQRNVMLFRLLSVATP